MRHRSGPEQREAGGGGGDLWREGSAAVRDDTWAQLRDNGLSLTVVVHTRASFSAHSLFALRLMQSRPGAVPNPPEV